MSTATSAMANEVIANLKSGVPCKGTVRSHSTDGSMNIAWVAIELPVVGERQVLVNDEKNLQPGQQVILECIPNPLKPERYMFSMVEVLTPEPTVATPSLPRSKGRGPWRRKRIVRRRIASKK